MMYTSSLMESLGYGQKSHTVSSDQFHSPAALRFGCKISRRFWDGSSLPTIKSDIIDSYAITEPQSGIAVSQM